jgi:hypothetical protein
MPTVVAETLEQMRGSLPRASARQRSQALLLLNNSAIYAAT